MRRRTLFDSGSGSIEVVPDGSVAPALSVVFANKSDGSLLIVENDKWSTTVLPPSKFEPIGIVVIPGEHGVLKDGTGTKNQCGVMSIVGMRYDTPETGGNGISMYFGGVSDKSNQIGVDISGKSDGLGRYDSVSNGLLNYTGFVITANKTSNKASGYLTQTTSERVFIPTQTSIGGIAESIGSDGRTAPSPYIGNDYKSGGYNDSYGLKNGVVVTEKNNALSDFKGIINTKIITNLATSQSNWKTASTITDSYNTGYYPAACVCARFKTTGTKAFVDCTTTELRNGTGFWYLPAAGELGYICPRFADINDTIEKIKTAYGCGYVVNSSIHHSSTEYDGFRNHAPDVYRGDIMGDHKSSNSYVRAFMRL